MGIYKVLSFGMLIIMLKFLVPEIFQGFQDTLLVFFGTAQATLISAKAGMTTGVTIPTGIPTVP
jgi:hypothetical protein